MRATAIRYIRILQRLVWCNNGKAWILREKICVSMPVHIYTLACFDRRLKSSPLTARKHTHTHTETPIVHAWETSYFEFLREPRRNQCRNSIFLSVISLRIRLCTRLFFKTEAFHLEKSTIATLSYTDNQSSVLNLAQLELSWTRGKKKKCINVYS